MTKSWIWLGMSLLAALLMAGCNTGDDDDDSGADDDASDDDASDDDASDDDATDDDTGDDDDDDDTSGDDDSGDDDISGDDDTGGDDDDSAHQDDLQHVQSVVFTKYCASCHDGSHASGLDLSDGNTYANTVGVASTQLPSMNRITAGDSANSYLWHKLEDTQGTVGGSGDQMPLNATLPTGKKNKVQSWIDGGANP